MPVRELCRTRCGHFQNLSLHSTISRTTRPLGRCNDVARLWHVSCFGPSIMCKRIEEVARVLAALAVLVFGVLLVGLGCSAIYWFFWSQGTCGPDIGFGLLFGAFLVVYGKRTFVLAFEMVSALSRPITLMDVAVVVALAVFVLSVSAGPFLAELASREWAGASSRPADASSLKANDDQPSLDYLEGDLTNKDSRGHHGGATRYHSGSH